MTEHDDKLRETGRAQCRQFDRDLSAYLEGEEKAGVLTHARECPFCAVVLADLEQIRFSSHHLPLVDPPARVWANVRATLAEEGILHEQVPAWQRWYHRLPLFAESVPVGALAALAVLAIALLTSPISPDNQGTAASVSADQQIVTAGIWPAGIDSGMTRTVEEMQEAFRGRQSSMEPSLRETYRKSLASLDASIEDCIKHCRREPCDALARQYLARAYQSKADVLASALDSSDH
jgi:hypothetical protein